MQDIGDVRRICLICRDVWENVWFEWKLRSGYPVVEGELPSVGCCIPTSFALEGVLSAVVPNWRWRTVGSRPTQRTPAGGYTDADGVSHPHLWVEGRSREGVIVADITCDQFGGPAISVIEGPSPHHVANSTHKLISVYRAHETRTFTSWMNLVARFG